MKRVKREPLGSAVTTRTELLRKALGCRRTGLRVEFMGSPSRFFDLINRVQKTDQISYRRQIMMDGLGDHEAQWGSNLLSSRV